MMEIIVNKKDKPDIDKLVEFLKTLTPEEQQAISYIMQGMKLKDLLTEKKSA